MLNKIKKNIIPSKIFKLFQIQNIKSMCKGKACGRL